MEPNIFTIIYGTAAITAMNKTAGQEFVLGVGSPVGDWWSLLCMEASAQAFKINNIRKKLNIRKILQEKCTIYFEFIFSSNTEKN